MADFSYDVFLSHSSKDKVVVRALAAHRVGVRRLSGLRTLRVCDGKQCSERCPADGEQLSDAQHHAAQISGRDGVFRDYRIRVAAVVRDYGMYERAQAPQPMPQVAHKRA